MPFAINGYIEIAWGNTVDEHAWFGLVDLSSIVHVGDEDGERLFGLSKACVSGEKSVDSLAAGRGVPTNPSAQVRQELVEIAGLEAKYGGGELGGYTYASWAEIRDYTLIVSDSQWAIPFAFARILEERLGADRIRFVVWFDW